MQRYNDNILARSGGFVIPAAGASVTVKNYPAGTVATIYSDDGVTPKTNPIVTGTEGEFFFYAADGRYSLEISGGGYTGGNVVDITLDGLGDADVDVLRTDLASTAIGKGAALVGAEDGAGGTLWTEVQGFINKVISSAGSAVIGFIQAGTGAVLRSLQDKARDQFHVKDFGITYSGDETTKFQAAINATPTGGILDLGAGTITYSTVTLSKAITLRGHNPTVSKLRQNSATGNGVVITAPDPVYLTNIRFEPAVAMTAGATVLFDAVSQGAFAGISRCWFVEPWKGIYFVDHGAFTVDECYFVNYGSTAIQVSNVPSPDTGDSTIENSVFDAGTLDSIAVLHESSGGLKIHDNKFLNGTYHYIGQYAGSADTSILLINNNSMEHASTASIAFSATSPRIFSVVKINDNQITVAATATGVSISDPGHAFLDNVQIGGNNFQLNNSATAMNFGRGTNIVIEPNTINGAGSSDIGISFVGSNVGAVVLHPQHMYGVSTQISGNVPVGSHIRLTYTVATTTADPTPLGTIALPDESLWMYSVKVVAKSNTTVTRAAYIRDAAVYRDAGGAATVEGAVSTPFTAESNAAMDATISVSSTDVRTLVTGVVGTINWVANVELRGL